MKEYIKKHILKILKVDEDKIKIEIPPKDNMGDYSIQCANLRNEEYSNPIEIANLIREKFNDEENNFSLIKVMGPYINFYLNYEKFNAEVIKDIEINDHYGSLNQGNNEALLIEHTSINPNAEPHIGRCRNSLIGDFMSNLYGFTGYEVERHYFINDIGKKIALLVIGIEEYGLKDGNFSSILDTYVKISNRAKEDESIDQKAFYYLQQVESGNTEMVQKFKEITDICVERQLQIFDTLDIHFDVFTHESDFVYNNYLDNILKRLDKTGRLHEDELGRLYVDLSGYDIPTREPVLVLTRSNKTSLYPMRDIAYTIHKIELNPKNNFIVLGEDQEVYMKQISAVLDILGYKAPKLISYSYVLLDGDKMSTSAGTVVLVTDFMKAVKNTLINEFNKRNSEISVDKLNILVNACIKFTMLNVSKNKIVNFNLENATSFVGESGMYILYSLVRINSILKNNNIELTEEIKFNNEIENKLVKELSLFPEVIDELLTSNEPAHLTKYIFGIAGLFSKFYEQVNISNEVDVVLKSSRIRLLKSTAKVLTNALSILGIKTIDEL
ncbi:arginyl-tRNA synthetase [human gut metagenome]|uniref:arginine--tRNA ligase n=1 Tax=human gut metagenome TaxID=408170 RepID=K1SCS4_9ZZZZ